VSGAKLPTLYIPHGGGPCFFMDVPPGLPLNLWDGMAAYLRGIAAGIKPRPRAVLVISAHWECPRPTVQSAARHSLLFDYYGFPEHTYRLTYPALGSPEVAARVRELLALAGIEAGEERERGLDHGVFVPFKLIYPQAEVPMLQLSLQTGLDPAKHLHIGYALEPLRNEGVLIVGSGMSYHNLRDLFSEDPAARDAAQRFDDWLGRTIPADAAARERALAQWAQAPGARECHPRSEHLIPLMVAAGAAGLDSGQRTYNERVLGKMISGFQFGVTDPQSAARLPALHGQR
jgi:aromatic ring-opening dioxygenase catalytic subunit (LigB family)